MDVHSELGKGGVTSVLLHICSSGLDINAVIVSTYSRYCTSGRPRRISDSANLFLNYLLVKYIAKPE